MVQRRVQLEHNIHIVKVGFEATCLHINPWRILNETTELVDPFETMPQEPWHPEKGNKPDCAIQLNCGDVRTYASYKTTRTCGNFNNWGTKIILLSDKLWLITNNSKSFATNSESIIRNNLGFCKHFEIYLFRTFKNIIIDLMV